MTRDSKGRFKKGHSLIRSSIARYSRPGKYRKARRRRKGAKRRRKLSVGRSTWKSRALPTGSVADAWNPWHNMPGRWWSGPRYRPVLSQRGPRGGKGYRPTLRRKPKHKAWLPTSFYTAPRLARGRK